MMESGRNTINIGTVVLLWRKSLSSVLLKFKFAVFDLFLFGPWLVVWSVTSRRSIAQMLDSNFVGVCFFDE
jgi:hypothetical protein